MKTLKQKKPFSSTNPELNYRRRKPLPFSSKSNKPSLGKSTRLDRDKSLQRDALYSCMKPGVVYRREDLLGFSSNLDRDLSRLVAENKLKKPATGLYYKPEVSRYGLLPPTNEALVKAFLKKPFLMYSWNDYNMLGFGLTQLYNRVVVYNSERHEDKKFGNKMFSFKRPSNGFPTKLTKEFLVVDLLNNAKYLTEDVSDLMMRVKRNLDRFDRRLLADLAMKYGKLATKKNLLAMLEG